MLSNEEILRIEKKLEEHDKRLSKLESLFQARPEAAKKKISTKEFILSKKPRDDVQRTLAIGYYLEKFKGFSTFNVKDLERGFGVAKEPIPENINDKVNLNIKKGHMMETDEKKDNLKAWVLTDSGEKYIDGDFKKEE